MRLRCKPIISALAVALPLALISAGRSDGQAVTKWRYDKGNTGWNSNETKLTRASVASVRFGKRWERAVDGQVYAQPLYVPNIAIPGKGTHNVVYIATEHNSVYAFDADSNTGLTNSLPLWQINLGPSVPSDTVGCGDLYPEYGITSTPTIDLATNRMFVCAKTLENGVQTWRINAINIRSGLLMAGWGVVVQGSVTNSTGATVSFATPIQLNRCGLVINNGRVYIGFGSHCDINLSAYHGWIFSYNISDPTETPQILCSSPDSDGSGEAAAGIWSSGAPPAFDEAGNMYYMTGNGLFDLDLYGQTIDGSVYRGKNMGDAFVKVATNGGTGFFFTPTNSNYFTPSNQQFLTDIDADLGSGGLILPPAQTDLSTPNLILGGGKDALLRLIDANNMGGFTGRIDGNAPNNVLQEVGFPNGFWSSPAYFGGNTGHYIYMNAVGDVLRQLRITRSNTGSASLQWVSAGATQTGYPSSTPIVSSNGGNIGTGVVWILNRNDGALHAYDAEDVSKEIFNSNWRQSDVIGDVIKFTVPMVANGKVYVGANGKVECYGGDPNIGDIVTSYALAGPTLVNLGQKGTYQLSALDRFNALINNDNRTPLVLVDQFGTVTSVGPIVFGGRSTKLWTKKFDRPGNYSYIAAPGTNKEVSLNVVVPPGNLQGADHFTISVTPQVAANRPFTYTLIARDVSDNQVNFTGTVMVTFTRPDGTIDTSQPSVTFSNSKRANGTATLTTPGSSIMMASDGARAGQTLLTVTGGN